MAHKEYLDFAKPKKPSKERIGQTIKSQLSYVHRNLKYVDTLLQEDRRLDSRSEELLPIIRKVYEQQKYMFENKTHKVENRIVSITQPYVRPIVRGKANKPTEFGAKLHLSIDERGFGRIEHLSFEAYNEGPLLQQALENPQISYRCLSVMSIFFRIFDYKNPERSCPIVCQYHQ